MKYHITTFGCQMNVHESEKLAGVLTKLGYTFSNEISEADVIVFNTCAVREGAENRALGNIGALKKLKKDNPNKIIAVCGCMTQQQKVSEKLHKTFPFVDIIFGTKNFEKFEEYLITVQSERRARILEVSENEEIVEGMPILRSSGNNYWVNIIYGCNNFCTYCIVPYVRGRERSRAKEHILQEIKELIEQSSEKIRITLLGQNVNSYGKDRYKNYGFAELLKDVCTLSGNFELTFMTSHPKDLTDEVIKTIASESKILKEVHLPVQSGSNKILKMMNRRYSVEDYLDKVHKLKKLAPEVRLTTDIIVGFPGETEQDFQDTCDIIESVKYSGVFAFMFSPRKDTKAEKFKDQVSLDVKKERVNRILALAKLNKEEPWL